MAIMEIYMCRPGQKLEDGRLDYADDIANKAQAQADAEQRCRRDPKLDRVIYYAVQPDNNFQRLLTYTNPNPVIENPNPVVEPDRIPPAPVQETGFRAWLIKVLGKICDRLAVKGAQDCG